MGKLARLNGLIPTTDETNKALLSLSGDKFDLQNDSQRQRILKLIESVLSPATYAELMKEDRMQTLVFIVFVYKYVKLQANDYIPKSIRSLNYKLGNANCVKIE